MPPAPRRWDYGHYNANTIPTGGTTSLDFLEGIDHPLTDGEFHFIHLLIPHRPWIFLPEGRATRLWATLGKANAASWGTDAWLVEQAYQRHQIQAQYVDGIVGQT